MVDTAGKDCKVERFWLDSDRMVSDKLDGPWFAGTHKECCDYLRSHRAGKRGTELAIVYVASGRLASYVL